MMVASVQEMLSDIPPNLAEDVVRGEIRLAEGGRSCPASRAGSRSPPASLSWSSTTRCGALSGAAEILDRGSGPSVAGNS